MCRGACSRPGERPDLPLPLLLQPHQQKYLKRRSSTTASASPRKLHAASLRRRKVDAVHVSILRGQQLREEAEHTGEESFPQMTPLLRPTRPLSGSAKPPQSSPQQRVSIRQSCPSSAAEAQDGERGLLEAPWRSFEGPVLKRPTPPEEQRDPGRHAWGVVQHPPQLWRQQQEQQDLKLQLQKQASQPKLSIAKWMAAAAAAPKGHAGAGTLVFDPDDVRSPPPMGAAPAPPPEPPRSLEEPCGRGVELDVRAARSESLPPGGNRQSSWCHHASVLSCVLQPAQLHGLSSPLYKVGSRVAGIKACLRGAASQQSLWQGSQQTGSS